LAPYGALVFKFEQVFCSASPNYTALLDLIKKEEQTLGSAPKLLGVGARMLALKKVMAPKAYKQFYALAESAAEKAETESLSQAPLLPGVTEALEAAHAAGWLVAVASDFGGKSVFKSLEQKSLAKKADLIVARARIDEDRQLVKKLSPVKRKVKSLTRAVYFCNRSREIKEAKSLGMRCMVLPSKTESFRTLLWAQPDGMILSLQELPQLLELPSMKLPEQKQQVTAVPSESLPGQPATPSTKSAKADEGSSELDRLR